MSADQNQSLPQPAVSSQPDSVANPSSGTSKPAQSVQLAISETKTIKKSPTRPSVEQSTIADLRLSRDVMARQLDYDDKQLYTEAMKANRADLDLSKSPSPIREQSEFFRIQPHQPSSPSAAAQPSGSKKRRRN